MLALFKAAVKRSRLIRRFVAESEKLRAQIQELTRFVPPGHFFSPIPSLDEIKKDEARIFESIPRGLIGIDLQEAEQLTLLDKFVQYYEEMPFQSQKAEGLRYYFENPAYSYSDGIMLYCMIRYLNPNKYIEVGSGYSSCVTLDTNELFFGGSIFITFIEPHPKLLMSLLKEKDKGKVRILPSRLQDIGVSEFEALRRNDILFIDSTHVSKVGSDVNYIFFEILPRLSSGVYVHFHDVFYPFEYPKEWVYEGRAWNEAYMLRTFLEYNDAFRIVLMNTFVERYHESFFHEKMPLCLRDTGGSIWIQKL
jgi:hypothetical protein